MSKVVFAVLAIGLLTNTFSAGVSSPVKTRPEFAYDNAPMVGITQYDPKKGKLVVALPLSAVDSSADKIDLQPLNMDGTVASTSCLYPPFEEGALQFESCFRGQAVGTGSSNIQIRKEKGYMLYIIDFSDYPSSKEDKMAMNIRSFDKVGSILQWDDVSQKNYNEPEWGNKKVYKTKQVVILPNATKGEVMANMIPGVSVLKNLKKQKNKKNETSEEAVNDEATETEE